MDGFDPTTMTYIGPTIMSTGPYQQGFVQPAPINVDVHDMYSNFAMSTFAGSEDYNFTSMAPPRSQAHLQHAGSIYDETAFSDVVSQFGPAANPENQEQETTIGRDNKLLSFSSPAYNHVLLDYSFQQLSLNISAQLHGMFFLAEVPWTSTGDDSVPPPSELTCYRRNLFQISGSVTIPRSLHCIMNEQGEQIPITAQELTISATESTEQNTVKLISVPWKTPVNPTQPANADDKAEKEPPAIPLDLLGAPEGDADYAQIPIQWRRLQFRVATANNGRRKDLQQHFVLRLKVMATLANGQRVALCEARSGAVIVRGRSPRNFQSRKDTPLNGTASHARKSATSVPQVSQPPRHNSAEMVNKTPASAASHKIEHFAAPAPSVISYFDPAELGGVGPDGLYNNMMYTNLNVNKLMGNQGAMTSIPQDAFSLDKHRGYAASSPDLTRNANGKRSTPTPSAPIQLSLIDDENLAQEPPLKRIASDDVRWPSPSQQINSGGVGANFGVQRTPTPTAGAGGLGGDVSVKKPALTPMRPPSFSLNTVSTPDEAADLLYEYFPLGPDDWMPPVDAVYRPHVVHHIKVNSDPRDVMGHGGKGRNTRYFSEVAG